MRRIAVAPRADWHARVEELGFGFHTIQGEPYWTEDAAYLLSEAEIDRLEDAAQTLENMCLDLVADVVDRGSYEEFGLSDTACALAEQSWQAQQRNLYGRFDLAFAADGTPKLLEYNADTPTALFEASVVQWEWLEHHFPDQDQFNSIHERLIEAWRNFGIGPTRLHFTCLRDHAEDFGTTEYLRDTALQAGLNAEHLFIDEIGWDGRRFVDGKGQAITHLFKLYPWEWLLREEFGAHVAASGTQFIEPAWKQLLSTKALLPALWARHRGHPLLLAASFQAEDIDGPLVRKPLWGREGAGVALIDRSGRITDETPAGEPSPGHIYQSELPLQSFDGNYPILGAWVIASQSCGLGIREDRSRITRNTSRFVPHSFA